MKTFENINEVICKNIRKRRIHYNKSVTKNGAEPPTTNQESSTPAPKRLGCIIT